MNASAVFIHQDYFRAALQVTPDDFFAVQTRGREDIGLEDVIAGDLAMDEVKCFFNLTKRTLIHVRVLGRFATLQCAIGAVSVNTEV